MSQAAHSVLRERVAAISAAHCTMTDHGIVEVVHSRAARVVMLKSSAKSTDTNGRLRAEAAALALPLPEARQVLDHLAAAVHEIEDYTPAQPASGRMLRPGTPRPAHSPPSSEPEARSVSRALSVSPEPDPEQLDLFPASPSSKPTSVQSPAAQQQHERSRRAR